MEASSRTSPAVQLWGMRRLQAHMTEAAREGQVKPQRPLVTALRDENGRKRSVKGSIIFTFTFTFFHRKQKRSEDAQITFVFIFIFFLPFSFSFFSNYFHFRLALKVDKISETIIGNR